PPGLAAPPSRTGPTPQFQPADPARHHWFTGDGMIHAFALGGGRAAYRNRWIRTEKFRAEADAGRPMEGGVDTGSANTNIVAHAGRLLALEEAHLPMELAPATLATIGPQDFAGGLH